MQRMCLCTTHLWRPENRLSYLSSGVFPLLWKTGSLTDLESHHVTQAHWVTGFQRFARFHLLCHILGWATMPGFCRFQKSERQVLTDSHLPSPDNVCLPAEYRRDAEVSDKLTLSKSPVQESRRCKKCSENPTVYASKSRGEGKEDSKRSGKGEKVYFSFFSSASCCLHILIVPLY